LQVKSNYQKILVSAGAGIGDILLATPLIGSLRQAYPDAEIDVLVPRGQGHILKGNKDVTKILEERKGKGFLAQLKSFIKMWRSYDLALSARAGDRYMYNTWVSGRKRMSWVNSDTGLQRWKDSMLDAWVEIDANTHTVITGLRLLDTLGIEKSYRIVPPVCSPADKQELEQMLPFPADTQAYVVIHVFPNSLYKCWTIQGWETVIVDFSSKGIPVVLTGGNGDQEKNYLDRLLQRGFDSNLVNLAGKINLSQTSELLSHAAVYLGLDTGMTHIAAACEIPTIAIFGPSNPVQWGPWPAGFCGDRSPYKDRVSQAVNNVFILRSDIQCKGSGNEGCFKDLNQPRLCLQSLSAESVLKTIEQAMSGKTGSASNAF